MHTRREFLKILLAIPFLPTFVRRFAASSTPLCEAYVAGYRFYDGDTVIERLHVGMPLQLRREPTNQYDSKAIEILTQDGVKLGYVPMRLNSRPASLLDSGTRVIAEIVELDSDTVPWERVKFLLRACA
jgi:hypothetical protein